VDPEGRQPARERDARELQAQGPEERARIARVFARGLTEPAGHVLPVQRWQSKAPDASWRSEKWKTAPRPGVPGAGRQPGGLPPAARVAAARAAVAIPTPTSPIRAIPPDRCPISREASCALETEPPMHVQPVARPCAAGRRSTTSSRPWDHRRRRAHRDLGRAARRAALRVHAAGGATSRTISNWWPPPRPPPPSWACRVHIEGYAPPHDPRLNVIRVAPDPGVIEVNVHPAASWEDCVAITEGVYEEARPAVWAPTSS
jgi:hypothetical protein